MISLYCTHTAHLEKTVKTSTLLPAGQCPAGYFFGQFAAQKKRVAIAILFSLTCLPLFPQMLLCQSTNVFQGRHFQVSAQRVEFFILQLHFAPDYAMYTIHYTNCTVPHAWNLCSLVKSFTTSQHCLHNSFAITVISVLALLA